MDSRCTGMVRMCENAGCLGMLQNNAHGGVAGEKSFMHRHHTPVPLPPQRVSELSVWRSCLTL